MKNLTLISRSFKITILIALVAIFITPSISFAQPPKWAPAKGYRAKTRHVYFPEQNFYYDVQQRNYIYLNGRNWVVSRTLPRIFSGINLTRSSQIELDYVGKTPYIYNTTHKVKYKKAKAYNGPKKKVVVRNVPKRKVNVNTNNNGHGNAHSHSNGKKK